MKKVFYILNLLFLTLFVFGGSVFAAAPPTQYIDENGIVQTISSGQTVNHLTDGAPKGGWYYLDKNDTTLAVTIGESSSTNPVNIVVNGEVKLPYASNLNSGSYIQVPGNAYVNFYGATPTSSLTISNSYGTYTIGSSADSGGLGNFGNITFNSGSYTVINTKGVPIGSNTNSGGTITVNSAASVQAYNNSNNNPPVAAVGVTESSDSCNLVVDGGLINCTNGQYTFGINVGTGSVKISSQGKILSTVNPNETGWIINSGIAGYTLGTNQWAAVVGGNVTLPVESGELQQDLDPPANADGGCWNLLTVNSGAVLNLGTINEDGTLNPAKFLVSYGYASNLSEVINNGTVNINAIDQTIGGGDIIYAPVIWNNNPGSTLTINEGTSSALTVYQLNNGDQASSQQASTVNLYGNLQLGSGNVTPNVFNNYSQLNIGSIGQVVNVNYQNGTVLTGGELINNAGGTVTSQNPCYYENQVNLLISSL